MRETTWLCILKLKRKLRRLDKMVKAIQRFGAPLSSIPNDTSCFNVVFLIFLIICSIILGFSLHFRNTNIWQLKNLGDSFMIKRIGRRPIIIGVFHRPSGEQNVEGNFVVIHFLGDNGQTHSLYCYSRDSNGKQQVTEAQIIRIHAGKRSANKICSWSGFLAECNVGQNNLPSLRVSTRSNDPSPMDIMIERPLSEPQHELVVCVAPMYTYTEWQIMLLGIETWLALGATKIVIPIQSASKNAYLLLQQYEKQGFVILRHWPRWPILSDVNPNGLILSRGIEESHVNCLFFVKPWAKWVVFTDIDDMLIPPNPMNIFPKANIELLKNLLQEHQQAGSFLFEHKETQLLLPKNDGPTTINKFDFEFLANTKWKSNCNVWRMKTRVAVIASKVDSVNMHETGIHRFGAVQSFKNRVKTSFADISETPLNESSTKSFANFDRCMASISDEQYTLQVSRCFTPLNCYAHLSINMECIASLGSYVFSHFDGDFVIALNKTEFVESEPNCESPSAVYITGDHFYIP